MIQAVSFGSNPVQKGATAVKKAATDAVSEYRNTFLTRTDGGYRMPAPRNEATFVPTPEQAEIMKAQRLGLQGSGIGSNHPMIG